jgi:hypothetical protein
LSILFCAGWPKGLGKSLIEKALKKLSVIVLAVLAFGLPVLQAQVTCDVELGYNDFPYTDGAQTIGLSTTGSGMSYPFSYFDCGITTKANSIYVGAGVGTFTNTFSVPVNTIVYRFTAADNGEVITVTTDPPGTVSIAYIDGNCPELVTIVDNVITFPGVVRRRCAGDFIHDGLYLNYFISQRAE